MAEKKTNPEVRFAGFTDNWKNWKIGEVLTERKNPIELQDDEVYELVKVKRRNEGVVSRGFLKGKDILTKTYFEIREGDYIISKRQVVHGANGIVPKSLNKAVVSNEYLVLTGNEKICTEFWTIISKLPNMYRKFFFSSYGVDIEKLVFDVEDWKKHTVVIPELNEQKRIIQLLNVLENLIILNQKKYDKLVTIKKALLEKMFPTNGANIPEIRISGYNEAWEEIELRDIISDFIVPMRDKPKKFSGNIPWTRIEDIQGRHLNDSLSGQYVSEETIKQMNLKIIPKGSLIVSASATFGIVAIVTKDLITNQTFIGLVPKLNNDLIFLYTLFKSSSVQSKLRLASAGSTIFYIPRLMFEEMKIMYPKAEEQKAIGSFFQHLDNLISLYQCELEKLKNIKKACFEKMIS